MYKLYILLLIVTGLYSCSEQVVTDKQTNADTIPVVAAAIPEDCNDAGAAMRIEQAMSIQTLIDMNIDEVKEWKSLKEKPMQGLQSFELDTLLNEHCLISMRATYEWMAAYPSTGNTYKTFSKKTGDVLPIAALLDTTKVATLLKLCNDRLQHNIARGREGLTPADGLEDYNARIMEQKPVFTRESLNDYYLKDKTILFVYPFGFPHVMLGLEPDGEIKLTAKEIQPYLNVSGPLGYWVE